MQTNFTVIISYLLEEEGGYSNHPEDRGGETKWGVTQHFLNHVIGDATLVNFDTLPPSVRDLQRDQAESIYEYYFWRLPKINTLPDGVDLLCLDYAVNSGPEQAIKSLQVALNEVRKLRRGDLLWTQIDGILGPKTLQALTDCYRNELMCRYTIERLYRLKSLPTWTTFAGGWIARIIRQSYRATQLYYTRELRELSQKLVNLEGSQHE